jgi:tRNA (mo5U34)-methyltransferase
VAEVAEVGEMTAEEAQRLVVEQGHWHHTFEVFPGVVTPGSYDPGFLVELLGLPESLEGKTVLEIGPSDGAFTLALAKRGAKVTCVDYRPKDLHGFAMMERITGRSFEYIVSNMYDIDAQQMGKFDIVLFLGVLYHLPDMMRSLSVLRSVCNGVMFLETECDTSLPAGIAAARYYEGATLNGDYSNFWAPNVECVQAMCRDSGFSVARTETWGTRMFAECHVEKLPAKHILGYGTFLDFQK